MSMLMPMPTLALPVLAWSAWAPLELPPRDWTTAAAVADYDREATPPCAFVKALLRRRFSLLDRMAATVVHDCLDPAAPPPSLLISASEHGQAGRAADMLASLARQEPLSPTDFALSVHNASAGLIAIGMGVTAPATSIAAGAGTCQAALLEAAARLVEDPSRRILVVVADDVVPAVYRSYVDWVQCPHALALLVGGDGIPLSLDFSGSLSTAGETAALLPTTMRLAQWLASDAPAVVLAGGGLRLTLRWPGSAERLKSAARWI